MSKNPLALKIASPYARALFSYSVEKNLLHQVTADFQSLEIFFNNTPELVRYLANPVISKKAKKEILTKTIKSKLNHDTFNFLMILINRDRINLVTAVINSYLELVYDTASIIMIEVATAFPFNRSQKNTLVKKLKQITNAREIRLVIEVDSNLIGGFLIKTKSKTVDFTIKNQLQSLAKHLDTVLDI
jgi:F-type H+-transporting ATPase subunit delta